MLIGKRRLVAIIREELDRALIIREEESKKTKMTPAQKIAMEKACSMIKSYYQKLLSNKPLSNEDINKLVGSSLAAQMRANYDGHINIELAKLTDKPVQQRLLIFGVTQGNTNELDAIQKIADNLREKAAKDKDVTLSSDEVDTSGYIRSIGIGKNICDFRESIVDKSDEEKIEKIAKEKIEDETVQEIDSFVNEVLIGFKNDR